MLRPSITLHIPQPCAETWAVMTPTATGRHCAACQKTVVDFSLKTDAEILAYFRQAAGERACGRFRAGQLGRALRPALPVARPPHWQLWLAGLLAAALAVQGCQTTTGEVRPATLQRLPPPPPFLATPTIDSTTVGDVDTIIGDSVTVSAASSDYLLGAPRAY